MSDKINSIDLVLGDWSSDGHGKMETIAIVSHSTAREIEEAYQKGVEIGFPDLVEEACESYEEGSLTLDFACRFIRALMDNSAHFSLADRKSIIDIVVNGTDLDQDEDAIGQLSRIAGDDLEEPDFGYLETQGFAILYLTICKVGNPNLTLALDSDRGRLCIGGYGLFT